MDAWDREQLARRALDVIGAMSDVPPGLLLTVLQLAMGLVIAGDDAALEAQAFERRLQLSADAPRSR